MIICLHTVRCLQVINNNDSQWAIIVSSNYYWYKRTYIYSASTSPIEYE